MNYQAVLDAMRENVRTAQGAYTDVTWSRDRMIKPLPYYTGGEFRFDTQFRDQRALLQRGRVVWGAVIEVNDESATADSVEIAVVYAPGRRFDESPTQLQELGQRLTELDKSEPFADDDEPWGEKLRRVDKMALPQQWTDGTPCYCGNLLVSLPHLPSGAIRHWLVPILILPEFTDAAIVLPHFYWNELFREEWLKP